MCTIIVFNEVMPGHPLVVAANRDEFYSRASAPPAVTQLYDGRRLIHPIDMVRGGTWIGAGQDGWFVGITNQDDGDHNPDALSRGGLVDELLRANTHADAARALSEVDPGAYNPFNLVFGRPGAMFLIRVLAGRPVEMTPIPQGVHAFSNDCWGQQYAKKTAWAARFASSLVTDPPVEPIREVVNRLFVTLASHFETRQAKDDPYQAVCVHDDKRGFGTVSSSVITVSNQGVTEYWFKEGHACQLTNLSLAGRLSNTDE